MNTINFPHRSHWNRLCKRPSIDLQTLENDVADIMNDVKIDGDLALKKFNKKFDGVDSIKIALDITDQSFKISKKLQQAIIQAQKNIEHFHATQQIYSEKIETSKGVFCWRKSVGIETVGLYIPGGTAPLFSTLLMLAIPAQLAKCKNIVVCTPPMANDKISSALGWTCKLLGINQVFLVGGAQAIAAMAYGTASIPKVDKLFGPGNQYVTVAKQLAQQQGIPIDMPAGPSEILIIADETAHPEFIAADLLSQAEHGIDSQVILLSDSQMLIQNTKKALQTQLKKLDRKKIIEQVLKKSTCILLKNLEEAMEFSNLYAPEHLIISTKCDHQLSDLVVNAGSVFLGKWSCESAGDYITGPNHTLPTNGFAKNYSGVSLDSFVKNITFQYLTKEGILNIGDSIAEMAMSEGLDAHRNAVSMRLAMINT